MYDSETGDKSPVPGLPDRGPGLYLHRLRPQGTGKGKAGSGSEYHNQKVLPVVFERPSGKPLYFPGLRDLPVPGEPHRVSENRF
jgi:hypothetical protein